MAYEAYFCSTCKKSNLSSRNHVCPPKWLCIIEGNGPYFAISDALLVYADDAEQAAELAAEQYDAGEYHIVSRNEIVVVFVFLDIYTDEDHVSTILPISSAHSVWAVEGRSEPHYSGNEMTINSDRLSPEVTSTEEALAAFVNGTGKDQLFFSDLGCRCALRREAGLP